MEVLSTLGAWTCARRGEDEWARWKANNGLEIFMISNLIQRRQLRQLEQQGILIQRRAPCHRIIH